MTLGELREKMTPDEIQLWNVFYKWKNQKAQVPAGGTSMRRR